MVFLIHTELRCTVSHTSEFLLLRKRNLFEQCVVFQTVLMFQKCALNIEVKNSKRFTADDYCRRSLRRKRNTWYGDYVRVSAPKHFDSVINPLTPNDPYRGRTAPLTSKRCILYIYSTNISTEYFKHGVYSPFFSLQNAVCFIILTHLVPVLFTFCIQGVLKLKK